MSKHIISSTAPAVYEVLWLEKIQQPYRVSKLYVDLAGDLTAGIVLGQIVYWWLPARNGDSKLRIFREGRYWLAKKLSDWYEELRVTMKQARRALQILKEKKYIETKVWKFAGTPTTHIWLNIEKLLADVKKLRPDLDIENENELKQLKELKEAENCPEVVNNGQDRDNSVFSEDKPQTLDSSGFALEDKTYNTKIKKNFNKGVNTTSPKEKQEMVKIEVRKEDEELVSKLIKNNIPMNVIIKVLHTAEDAKTNIKKLLDSVYFKTRVLNPVAFIICAIKNGWEFDTLNNRPAKKKNYNYWGWKGDNSKKVKHEERDPSTYTQLEDLYKKALWGKDAEEAFKRRQKQKERPLREERNPSTYTAMEEVFKKALHGQAVVENTQEKQTTNSIPAGENNRSLKEERNNSVYIGMEKLYKEYLRSGNFEETEKEVLKFLGVNPA